MENKTKLYFKSEDDVRCSPLEDFINEAKCDGLKEITLIEAIPDNDGIWCLYSGESTERGDCKKSVCSYYESKSGRGICKHRGQLYYHGNKVVFLKQDLLIEQLNKITNNGK